MGTIEQRLLGILKNTQREAGKDSIVKYLSFMEVLLSIIIDWRDAIEVMDHAGKTIGILINADICDSVNVDAGLESMAELRSIIYRFKNGE